MVEYLKYTQDQEISEEIKAKLAAMFAASLNPRLRWTIKYARLGLEIGIGAGDNILHKWVVEKNELPFISLRSMKGMHDAGKISVVKNPPQVLLHNQSSDYHAVPAGAESNSKLWDQIVEVERNKTMKILSPLFSAMVNFPQTNQVFTAQPTISYSVEKRYKY